MSEFVDLVHPYFLSVRYFNGTGNAMNVQIRSGQEDLGRKKLARWWCSFSCKFLSWFVLEMRLSNWYGMKEDFDSSRNLMVDAQVDKFETTVEIMRVHVSHVVLNNPIENRHDKDRRW